MSTTPHVVQETHGACPESEAIRESLGTGAIRDRLSVRRNQGKQYLYQGKEMIEDNNLNLYDFHALGYDPVIGRTLQMDPMADSYYPWSPYAWAMNNPIKYMDPTGMFSTHTDEDGIVVAVYDDGDLGVYKHQGSRGKAAETVKGDYSEDNTGASGERMGESLHALSFADQSLYNMNGTVKEARIKIDFGSSNLTDRVQEILNSDPSLFDYFKMAGGGGDWDIKAHVSNGSKLYGKYASPRDAGNIYGSLFGTAKHPVLKAMGAFNANQNKLNLNLAGQLFQNWGVPYGEDYRSHYMQNVGFDMGKSNLLFKKKFGVK